MKKRLEDDLIVALTPYLKDLSGQDLRMRIEMILAGYEISKSEHALTVYEGDINENILKRFLAAKIPGYLGRRTGAGSREVCDMITAMADNPPMFIMVMIISLIGACIALSWLGK